MFTKLKQLFQSSACGKDDKDENSHAAAENIEAELSSLEAGLLNNPADNEIKKQLMVKYNQAIKIYSGNRDYRHQVDALFIRMDELRNTIRRNI